MKSKESDNQSLQQGAYIMLFTAILTKLIGALFKIPISQDYCLGDLGFGYFSAAYDLYTPISTLAISGFPLALSRIIADYVAQNKYAEIKEAFKCSKKVLIVVSLIEFVLISLIILPFSKLTDTTGNGIYSLIAILPSVIISTVLSLYRGYFEGFSNMKPPAISNIIEALGKLILGFSFAIITLKITNNVGFAAAGALIGISVGLIISSAYIYFKYKNDVKKIEFESYRLSDDFNSSSLTKNIIAITLPIGLSSLAGSFVALIDTLTVRAQLTSLISSDNSYFSALFKGLIREANIESVELLPTVLYGIKGKAFTLFNIILTLTMSLGISAVPSITKFKSQNNEEEMLKSANTSLKLTTLICFPVSAGFVAVGKQIVSLLFGNGDSAIIGGKMLMIYGLATVFAGCSIVLGNILQGMGSHKAVFKNIFLGILLKTVLNFVFTGFKGINIYGCCYSTLICYTFIFLMHIISFYKCCKKLPQKSIALKPLISSVICGSAAFLIANISDSSLFVLLSIFVAAVIYFVFLLVLRFFEPQDFESLPFVTKIIDMCKKSKKQ